MLCPNPCYANFSKGWSLSPPPGHYCLTRMGHLTHSSQVWHPHPQTPFLFCGWTPGPCGTNGTLSLGFEQKCTVSQSFLVCLHYVQQNKLWHLSLWKSEICFMPQHLISISDMALKRMEALRLLGGQFCGDQRGTAGSSCLNLWPQGLFLPFSQVPRLVF